MPLASEKPMIAIKIRNSTNQLYAKTLDVGGYMLETGKDFVDLFKQNE